MQVSESKITVRYVETDQMGIVHHSNYFAWFEVGRGDFFRQLFAMSYRDMEATGVIMPLAEANCQYKSPAFYDDVLTIKTSIEEMSVVKVTFNYQVVRQGDNKLIAIGKTVHAFTNPDKKPLNLKKNYPDLYTRLYEIAHKEEI